MSTEVSTYRVPETLPALARPVPLSASLSHHVAGDTIIDGMLVRTVGRPSLADIQEAQRKLREAEHLCRPGNPRHIAVWCKKMEILPWAPTTEDASKASIMAICEACAALPAAVWTSDSAVVALRTWKRWPTPSDVYVLLSDLAKPYRRALSGLQRVAATGAPEPLEVKSAPTPDAPTHVASLVQAFIAERSFNAPGASPSDDRPVTPAPLSDGALIQEYERIASEGRPFAGAAATRAKSLRKRLHEVDQER